MSPSLRWSGCAALLSLVGLAWVPDGSAAVVAYPSSQSIFPTGPLPPGGRTELVYNTAIGEREALLGGCELIVDSRMVAAGISATIAAKLAAMECYSAELRDYPHPRSTRALRQRAAFWGSVVDRSAVEPFVIMRELA